jgi:hypothetical protein
MQVSLEQQLPTHMCSISSPQALEREQTHPESAHDPIPQSPVAPHFRNNRMQALITYAAILALHPDFKHLNYVVGALVDVRNRAREGSI